MEQYEEFLEKISRPFILDDTPNLYRHIDQDGKIHLVSIPEDEEENL